MNLLKLLLGLKFEFIFFRVIKKVCLIAHVSELIGYPLPILLKMLEKRNDHLKPFRVLEGIDNSQ
jgi:hypothetical protein